MTILWTINDRDSKAFSLIDKEVHLYYTCERGRFEADIEIQGGNVVAWNFLGRDQRALGGYTLSLEILQSNGKRTIKKDICAAFVLVGKECEEKYDGEAEINEGGEITLSTDLDIYRISPIIPYVQYDERGYGYWYVDGVNTGDRSTGETAYEYAVSKGYEGTEEEFALMLVDAHAMMQSVENLRDEVEGLAEFHDTLANQVNSYKPIEIHGNVTNAPDEEDLTSSSGLLKIKNRNNLNGKGYIILRTGTSLSSQISQADTIYDVRYKFDLGGATITFKDNCCVRFNGGSFVNGKVVLNNTKIEGVGSFDCVVEGTVQDNVVVDYFGVSPANTPAENSANIKNIAVDNLDLLFNGEYHFNEPLTIYNNNIIGISKSKLVFPYTDGLVTASNAERIGKRISNLHIHAYGHCLNLVQANSTKKNHYVSSIFSDLVFESETTSAVYAEKANYGSVSNYGYNCRWENLLFLKCTNMFEKVTFFLGEYLTNITDYPSDSQGQSPTLGSAFKNCRFLHCVVENMNICNGQAMDHLIYDDEENVISGNHLIEFKHCNFEMMVNNLIVHNVSNVLRVKFTDCVYAYTKSLVGREVYCVDTTQDKYTLTKKTFTDADTFYPIVGRYIFVNWNNSNYSRAITFGAERDNLFCVYLSEMSQFQFYRISTNDRYGVFYFDVGKKWTRQMYGESSVQYEDTNEKFQPFTIDYDNYKHKGSNIFEGTVETPVFRIKDNKFYHKYIKITSGISVLNEAKTGTFFTIAEDSPAIYDVYVNMGDVVGYHMYLCQQEKATVIPIGNQYGYILRKGDRLHVYRESGNRTYSVERAFVNTLQAHYNTREDATSELQWGQTEADGSMTVVGKRLAIVTGGKLSNPNGSNFTDISAPEQTILQRDRPVVGDILYNTTRDMMVIYDGKKYGYIETIPMSDKVRGKYSEAPETSTPGRAYYCTDRKAPESDHYGIMLYWNEQEKVWTDALGREIN